MMNQSSKIKKMVVIALLCALAYMSMFVFHFKVMFLTFDPKDAILTLAGFLFGPLTGALSAFVVAFMEFFTVSGTGIYGFVMNFGSSAAFAVVAGLVYKYRRTLKGAVLALVSAVITMTAVMMILNLLVTPFYMHATVADVAALIPTLLLPFNFIKGVLNASLAYLLYRPLRSALRAAGFVPKGEKTAEVSRGASTAGLVIALVLAVVSVLIYLFVLNGSFLLFEA